MEVSVIIINYKTAELTIKSIESVKKFTSDVIYEIIVVDNASGDGSLEAIEAAVDGDVIFIKNKENVGFGRANNDGIGIARGEYVFLLNSDAFLTNNALLIFKKFMDTHMKVAVCGGNLITGRDDKTVSYGNLPSLFETFSDIGFFIFYRKYFMKHLAAGIVNASPENRIVGYINGANMFIRKSVLNEVGSFDKDFFMYFEETELSYRIKKAGYLCYIIPEATIIHIGSGSQKSTSFNYFNYTQYFKSKQIYFKKTSSMGNAFLVKILTIIKEITLHIAKMRGGSFVKKMSILFKY